MSSPSEEQLSLKKARDKAPHRRDAQPFDNLVKALFGEDGAQIVPELIEGAQVLSAENVELDRSKLKADLIYRGPFKNQKAVFDLEFQAGADPELIYRLLLYLAALYERYKCLIVCVIIYLFRCTIVKSPHIMQCDEDGEAFLTVKFRVICLWEMDPEPIVTKHLLPFYIFLPAMKNPSVDLLLQALKEMAQHYGRAALGYRFMWFSHILRRTDTMSETDKQTIEEAIKMLFTYEEIIKDDPVIQNLLAQSERAGEARGKLEGKLEGMREGKLEGKLEGEIEATRDAILSILSIRFSPVLAAQARPTVKRFQTAEALKMLLRQIIKAPDEQSVFLLLDLSDEQSQDVSSNLPTA